MMTPKELKILMIQKDIKCSDIAKKLDVTKSSIWMIRGGHGISARIEKAIADACGKDRADIFPIIPEPRIRRSEAA